MQIQEHVSLLQHNTFNINATARYLAVYSDEEELREALAWHHHNIPSLPILPLGRGSNILFTTPLFDGMVLIAEEKEEIQLTEAGKEGRKWLTAWAGQTMDEMIQWSINHGLHGLENLSWIPGSVGASAVQNIGAYGTEAGSYIKQVTAINRDTLDKRIFGGEELNYSYRDSWFKHNREWIVTRVTYELDTEFTPNLAYGGLAKMFEPVSDDRQATAITPHAVRQAIIDTRMAKLPDPKKEGNAGSFFMNPIVSKEDYEHIANDTRKSSDDHDIPHYPAPDGQVKLSAAWLIEQAGCKGMTLGHAAVSSRHALILINTGGATGQDITALCRTVQEQVRQRFRITLHPEVNFM